VRRKALLILGCAVLAYGMATLGLYIAMRQTPERFGSIMAKTPTIAMVVLPFKPLWMSARAGRLKTGDEAPDFALPTLDHSRTVKLSDEYREKPVVLVFGSYT
jgi:hypothetical protein